MKNIIKTTLMMLLAGSIITACNQKTEYPEPNTTAVTLPVAQTARVMFVNAGMDAPTLAFSVNNVVPTDGVLARGANSAYTTFDVLGTGAATTQFRASVSNTPFLFLYNPGRLDNSLDTIKTVAWRATNRTNTNPNPNPLLFNTNNFSASGGVSYSVFLADSVTRPARTEGGRSIDIGGPLLLVSNDNSFLTYTATASEVRLRLAHLSSNAPAVKITIGSVETQTATGTTVLLTNVNPPTFASVIYKGSTSRENIVLPLATLAVPATSVNNQLELKNVQVRAAVGNALITTIPSIIVDKNKSYTILASGKLGTPSFGVKVIQNN